MGRTSDENQTFDRILRVNATYHVALAVCNERHKQLLGELRHFIQDRSSHFRAPICGPQFSVWYRKIGYFAPRTTYDGSVYIRILDTLLLA